MVTLGWQARVLVLLRILSLVLLVCTVAMPAGAETGRDAARPDIADLDSAALRVFSPVPQEGREAMDWLVRHGDPARSRSSFSSCAGCPRTATCWSLG